MKPSENWLRAINERFRNTEIPPNIRPFLAVGEFSEEFKFPISMSSEITDYIFTWFYENTKPGSHTIGSLYKGAFYFDSCFWQIDIPIGIGSCYVNTFDRLRSMPDNLKAEIKLNRQLWWNFTFFCIDCWDYAYGYDNILKLNNLNQLAINFIKSAHKELQATVSLLLEDKPQAKAMETARMAVEMYLKSILIIKNNWSDEKELRSKFGHDLIKTAEKCIELTQSQEIKHIKNQLLIFTAIKSRYEGKDWTASELWLSYQLAQMIGTTFTRIFSNRDSRTQIINDRL